MSISVIIPTLNAEAHLPACFDYLAKGALEGVIREVIIADGGSTDATLELAEAVGAVIVDHEKGRGAQLRAGAKIARGEWLLFLHADTGFSEGWLEEVRRFIQREPETAGVFGLTFDASGFAPALVAGGAMVRTRMFKAPYGDQGLLISRTRYDDIGGFRDMPLFEDVDIIHRLRVRYGRKAITVLNANAITSPIRYQREGYANRVVRNFICIMMYIAGRPPEKIVDFYGAQSSQHSRHKASLGTETQ